MPLDTASRRRGFFDRWQTIKTEFSKRIATGEIRSPSRTSKGERGIWQRRFWEHTIRDDRDYAVHMDYIHFNPVKHGLVADPTQWPYSTFRRCVALGVYLPDWAGGTTAPVDAGEPLTG